MNDVETPDAPGFDSLRTDVVRCYTHLRRSGWDLAVHVSQICQDASYTAWGFSSAAAWAEADLPTIAKNLGHYRAAGTFLLALPEEEREKWIEFPVWHAIAGGKLLTQAPDVLLEKLQSGATQAQIRQASAKALPDQHHESEWRTIKLRVCLPVYELWERAVHRAEYDSCENTPTDDKIAEALANAKLDEPLWQPDNGFSPPAWKEFVEAGIVRCRKCGSQNRTQLDWHHVKARSAGGGEGPQVPLCRSCHIIVQPEWRKWCVEWGFEGEEDLILQTET
jgi:hypothetical protein